MDGKYQHETYMKISYRNKLEQCIFLGKHRAVWKFWPEGAILSWSRRLKDSMAPECQNFHTDHKLGGRNGILSFLLLSKVWKLDLTKLVLLAQTVWKYRSDWLVTKYWLLNAFAWFLSKVEVIKVLFLYFTK